MTGLRPRNVDLYLLAIRHSGSKGDSNERLEFLGDAILGSVVAEHLFKKYPFKDEGFLTEIRARIVNREALNELATRIGLSDLVQEHNRHLRGVQTASIYGNALEAVIGAVFIDKGYGECRRFILSRLLKAHIDIEEVVDTPRNYKSLLIEWSQRENFALEFRIVNEAGQHHSREFTAQVYLNDRPMGTGQGTSKKKAEQAAAANTCDQLQLLP